MLLQLTMNLNINTATMNKSKIYVRNKKKMRKNECCSKLSQGIESKPSSQQSSKSKRKKQKTKHIVLEMKAVKCRCSQFFSNTNDVTICIPNNLLVFIQLPLNANDVISCISNNIFLKLILS